MESVFDTSAMQNRDFAGSSVGCMMRKCSQKSVGGAELPTAEEQQSLLHGTLQQLWVLLGFCQRVCPDFCVTLVLPAGWHWNSFLSHRISMVDLKQPFLTLYALCPSLVLFLDLFFMCWSEVEYKRVPECRSAVAQGLPRLVQQQQLWQYGHAVLTLTWCFPAGIFYG